MDAQKRIDKVLAASMTRVQEEVAVLLGVPFTLAASQHGLVSKEVFFDNRSGKQIIATIDVTGDIEGVGFLAVGIKDAIRLGGTLIMLPASELEEVSAREEYSEEAEDSFGEIANIVAGSFTKSFEEMYPKRCRFIRKEQEVVVPVKVDVASDAPVPDQPYYQTAAAMTLNGKKLGELLFLVPARPFGLVDEESLAAEPAATPVTPPSQPAAAPQQEPAAAQQQAPAAASQQEPAPMPQVSADTALKSSDQPKFDLGKHQKRIDKILQACEKKLSSEIGALLGVDVSFSNQENSLIDKETFFQEEVNGKQVIAKMDVVGELQDNSYLFLPLKAAIHAGGVLIMLPPSELDSVVAEEDFGEDSQDAFGEVANIASGVYTSVFEEQYNQKIRFIKTAIEVVQPMKVDVESAEPIAKQPYYMSRMDLQVGGKALGQVRMLFPAAMLRLDGLGAPAAQAEPEMPVAATAEIPQQTVPATETVGKQQPSQTARDDRKQKQANLDKQQKRVDALLEECRKKLQIEVGSLLGAEVKLEDLTNTFVSKEKFFGEEAEGKQVMANLDVVGEVEGKSYLFLGLKDAIYVGGVLIMLPPSELETVVAEDEFGADSEDAFGEIANIIAGVYTGVFEADYPQKLRFIRKDLQQVMPMKVVMDSAEPVPDEAYYLSSMRMSLDKRQLGRLHLLVPAQLLQLEQLSELEQDDDLVVESSVETAPGVQQSAAPGRPARVGSGETSAAIDVLLISDDDVQAELIARVIAGQGLTSHRINFKENIHNYIPGQLQAVYIIMREVNEQAFGIAIKVSSSCSLPVIAAGPAWTRSTVIKAVKYGVSDILLVPASDADIQENLQNNLFRMAA